MKLKILFPISASLLVGVLCGRVIFSQYSNNIEEVISSKEPVYLLQQGVYSSLESMENATSNISDYLYIKQDDKYYVYLGVTTDKKIADKVKQNYDNIDIYIKENDVSNEALLLKLKENDKTIKEESNKKDILSFSKKSLEIFEETMKPAKTY